jgi:hypothetical protein
MHTHAHTGDWWPEPKLLTVETTIDSEITRAMLIEDGVTVPHAHINRKI